MAWSNWPSWLKGGIISVTLLLLLALFISLGNPSGWGGIFALVIILFGALPAFAIGAIIGRVTGKTEQEQPISESTSSKGGIIGLILSIFGIIFSFLFFIGIPLSVIGLIMSSAQKHKNPTSSSKAGVILGWIGIGLAILVLLLVGVFQNNLLTPSLKPIN